jgi:protease-4
MGAPWRDETDEERAKEQEIVDAFYAAFVGRVASGRHMTEEAVRELATGEVWLGEQAKELGLVDEVGDLERAVEIAAAMAKVAPRWGAVRLPRPLLGRVVDRFATSTARALADELEVRAGDRFRLG